MNDIVFKVIAAVVALVLAVAAATAEFLREKDRRLKWLLAVVTACLVGIVALALIYFERQDQLEREREQLVATQQANLQRDSLNQRLDASLAQLNNLKAAAETTAGRLVRVSTQAQGLADSLQHLSQGVGELEQTSNQIGSTLTMQEQTLSMQERALGLQGDAIRENLDNLERLMNPLTSLSIKVVYGYSLADPQLSNHFTKLRLHVDSLVDQYGEADASHIALDREGIVLSGSYRQLRRLRFLRTSPWIPRVTIDEQRPAALELGRQALTIEFAKGASTFEQGTSFGATDAMFRFVADWPETGAGLLRSDSVYLNPRNSIEPFVDFLSDSIYLVVSAVGVPLYSTGRLIGLKDLGDTNDARPIRDPCRKPYPPPRASNDPVRWYPPSSSGYGA